LFDISYLLLRQFWLNFLIFGQKKTASFLMGSGGFFKSLLAQFIGGLCLTWIYLTPNTSRWFETGATTDTTTHVEKEFACFYGVNIFQNLNSHNIQVVIKVKGRRILFKNQVLFRDFLKKV